VTTISQSDICEMIEHNTCKLTPEGTVGRGVGNRGRPLQSSVGEPVTGESVITTGARDGAAIIGAAVVGGGKSCARVPAIVANKPRRVAAIAVRLVFGCCCCCCCCCYFQNTSKSKRLPKFKLRPSRESV
jgi:hypothetical protein